MRSASSEGGEVWAVSEGLRSLRWRRWRWLRRPRRRRLPRRARQGRLSHFDLARKDCVGTARNTTSRVWFTVADGVLSDVYEPNVDTTNVETMQFIVTDGKSFTDLQSRDMTYTVDADPTGMVCTVTSQGAQLHAHDDVLHGPRARHGAGQDATCRAKGNLKLYVRLDPTVGGHGGGGAQNAGADSRHRRPRRARRRRHDDRDRGGQPRLREADLPRTAGRQALHEGAAPGTPGPPATGSPNSTAPASLTEYDSAPSGNVVLTAALHKQATLALGFGRTADQALGAPPDRSLDTPYALSLGALPARVGALRRAAGAAAPQRAPPATTSASTSSRPPRTRSSRARSPPGSPRRGARPCPPATGRTARRRTSAPTARCSAATSTRRSPRCWSRATSTTARDTARFLLERQQLADGRMPRNSLLNGKVAPDTGGDQLDETAFPILMAYQSGLSGDRDALHRPHPQGGRLPRRPRPVVRQRALGGAGRLLALDDRGRDRRARRRRHGSPPPSTTTTARSSTSPPPTTSSARSRAGRSRPRARTRPAATSSASRAPATRTPRSSTTSATAASTPTSAR